MATIKGPLYYRINTNGIPIPVKSTGFMNSISQVNTKLTALNRIKLGQNSGVIPKGKIDSESIKYEDEKWLVTINDNENEMKSMKNENIKYEGPGNEWATGFADYMRRRGGKTKTKRRKTKRRKTKRRRNKRSRRY